MKNIFTITVVSAYVDSPDNNKRLDLKSNLFRKSNMVGFYFNYEDAEKAVLNNENDFLELGTAKYDFIVIEERSEGTLDLASKRKWFLSECRKEINPDFKIGKDHPMYKSQFILHAIVKKISEPDWAVGLMNFGF